MSMPQRAKKMVRPSRRAVQQRELQILAKRPLSVEQPVARACGQRSRAQRIVLKVPAAFENMEKRKWDFRCSSSSRIYFFCCSYCSDRAIGRLEAFCSTISENLPWLVQMAFVARHPLIYQPLQHMVRLDELNNIDIPIINSCV
mmetsp:Transcript_3912/g.7231  ORF Transcript_3912/g.7231 Transcript_3912/m.7231 type:complete len:144 (-) Transcript_3912:67-498(-)